MMKRLYETKKHWDCILDNNHDMGWLELTEFLLLELVLWDIPAIKYVSFWVLFLPQLVFGIESKRCLGHDFLGVTFGRYWPGPAPAKSCEVSVYLEKISLVINMANDMHAYCVLFVLLCSYMVVFRECVFNGSWRFLFSLRSNLTHL